MNPSASTSKAADLAWAPVLAAAYALVAVAAALFLAAGFTNVASLIETIGSVAPASDRVGPFVGLCIIAAAALLLAMPLARSQLARIPADAVGTRIIALGATSLVLMAPPVQWVMFGRPDPGAAHENHAKQPVDDGHEHAAGEDSDGHDH